MDKLALKIASKVHEVTFTLQRVDLHIPEELYIQAFVSADPEDFWAAI
mgnify:CR=1 FL=1